MHKIGGHVYFEQLLQLKHTVGDQFCDETYHIPAIRRLMNLNLDEKLPELMEEMHLAFHEEFEPLIPESFTGSFLHQIQ
jgi:hypothetical protein